MNEPKEIVEWDESLGLHLLHGPHESFSRRTRIEQWGSTGSAG